MKSNLLILLALLMSFATFGQNVKLEIPIIKTGETQIEVEDDNDIVIDTITISISSDDAEQENDEMDTDIDDDIDAGWEGDDGDANILTAGLRFQNITIPQGATIDSAFIIVTSHEVKGVDDVANLTIYAEATDNAETFSMDALITDRTATTSSVRWVVNEAWGLWTKHQTPDLKTIVQEMVDRSGWQSGNAIAFIIKGEDQGISEVANAREWESFENIADPEEGGDGANHQDRVPKLIIYYTAPSYNLVIPIIKTGETEIEVEDDNDVVIDTITINISSDDAEQENDEMDTDIDDDIDAGWEGDDGDANILTAGLRFQNVTIPKEATIETAYIELTSHEAKGTDDVANLTIYAEATDNAETFSMDALITDRTATTSSVRWVVNEAWGLWTKHQTPDLKTIVQEMVDRSGWQSGNAIAFIIKGEDQGISEVANAREWESFENIADPEEGGDGANHQDRVPKLYVTFNLNGTSNIKEYSAKPEQISIFPNPTNTDVTVTLENQGIAKITIYNQLGIMVMQTIFETSEKIINVEKFSKGIYYIQIEQNNTTSSKKLIIE